MQETETKLLFTFHSTAEAMAAERVCTPLAPGGRLIPVPTSITAGCGLAWRCETAYREAVCTALQAHNITVQEVREHEFPVRRRNHR